MVVECISILMVLSLVIYQWVRTGKTRYVLNVLPVMTVPFVHPVVFWLTRSLSGGARSNAVIFVDIVAAAITFFTVCLNSKQIPSRTGKLFYVFSVAGFSAALAAILITGTLALSVG